MDAKLTEQLKAWLEEEPAKRDLAQGNLLLLKFSGNRVAYRMIAANPKKYADYMERTLRKYYNFRVREITHEQVEQMQKKVDAIVEKNISLSVKAEEAQPVGRRADHDELPENIRRLYERNLEILVKMRELHRTLRGLSLADAPCPDSERYPFLKELIALDKEAHRNWKAYDSYKAGEVKE